MILSCRHSVTPLKSKRKTVFRTPNLICTHVVSLTLVRLSGRNLNQIQTALAHRAVIFENASRDDSNDAKSEPHPYGEDVKIVSRRNLRPTLLTPAEKDDVVTQYESGLTMTAIAMQYRCHYTTVGYILRQRGVTIRE